MALMEAAIAQIPQFEEIVREPEKYLDRLSVLWFISR
jgi:hypothetical protein